MIPSDSFISLDDIQPAMERLMKPDNQVQLVIAF